MKSWIYLFAITGMTMCGRPVADGTFRKYSAMLALHPTGAPGKQITDGDGEYKRPYGKELAQHGYVVIAPFDVEGVRVGIRKAAEVYRFLKVENHLRVDYPDAKYDFPETCRQTAYQ